MIFIAIITILEILLFWASSIQQYNKGCEDTEKAYRNKKCDKCANWKTFNCPNSSLCYSTKNKPYFKIKEDKQ